MPSLEAESNTCRDLGMTAPNGIVECYRAGEGLGMTSYRDPLPRDFNPSCFRNSNGLIVYNNLGDAANTGKEPLCCSEIVAPEPPTTCEECHWYAPVCYRSWGTASAHGAWAVLSASDSGYVAFQGTGLSNEAACAARATFSSPGSSGGHAEYCHVDPAALVDFTFGWARS